MYLCATFVQLRSFKPILDKEAQPSAINVKFPPVFDGALHSVHLYKNLFFTFILNIKISKNKFT